MSAIDPTFVLFNRVEAGLWLAIALALAVAAYRRRHVRSCVIAAIAFALFGISDFVETHTGAWWRPWWLLAWKLACAFALLHLLLKHYLTRRTPACESPTPSR